MPPATHCTAATMLPSQCAPACVCLLSEPPWARTRDRHLWTRVRVLAPTIPRLSFPVVQRPLFAVRTSCGERGDRTQLLAHHDEVAGRQHLGPEKPSGSRRCRTRSFTERRVPCTAARTRYVTATSPNNRLIERNVKWSSSFERDELEDLRDALADGEVVHTRRQGARTATPEVVDPVVAVRRNPELADPPEDHWDRRAHVDGAVQRDIGVWEHAIARPYGRAFLRSRVPFGHVPAKRLHAYMTAGQRLRTLSEAPRPLGSAPALPSGGIGPPN